jgi:nucleoside-diphosphate-sugar epimerase
MIILVTGGSGFLGMNILSTLTLRHPDAQLIACDLNPPGPLQFQSAAGRSNVAYHSLDLRDQAACLRLLQHLRPTHVIHAATVTPAASIETDLSVNLHGTRHIFDAAIACGTVQRLVFLSSSGVYNQTMNELPCDEDHPLQLDTPYAAYKRQAELYLIERSQQLNVIIARVGPVYGPYEQPRMSRPTTSLVYQLVDAWRAGRTLKIAGSDSTRDWTHATDISCAIDDLLVHPSLKHLLYNVSGGISTSARTIIATMIHRGLAVTWQNDATTADLILDPKSDRKPLIIARLMSDTNFQPQFHFASGLDSLLDAASR